jgi:lipopolysaccharide export LptBFGC system permease protein LptF
VYRSDGARWRDGTLFLLGTAEKADLAESGIVTAKQVDAELGEIDNPFVQVRGKPTHVDSGILQDQIETADSELERRNLEVALQKKYAVVLLPLVIALFTAPFSLSLGRKGKVATIGSAVALWLLFTGVSSVFEQLGLNGILSPALAIWSPAFVFAFLGIYLLSRLRT